MWPFASCSWAAKLTLSCGRGYSALCPVHRRGQYIKWAEPKLWRIAGTGYLSGTPKKTSEDWPSEWFYMEDIPLLDPIRIGLPEFDNAPLKKRRSWRPRSLRRKITEKSFI